jgi:protein arginine N-methyltransferase 1
VQEIDIRTCTKEDLAFTAPFALRSRRADFMHALVLYFDCDFSACHTPVSFSTGPAAEYTHWKQTVFYLQNVLTLSVRGGQPGGGGALLGSNNTTFFLV